MMKSVKRSPQINYPSGKINLSFAGCGFLGIYHVGVASCFKKYAPHVYQEKISGASAGALVACALMADCSLGDCTTFTLNLALECRKHFLGPFSPNFHLVQDLKKALDEFLPKDAHIRASGKLHVSLTRFPDFENVLVSNFNNRNELIDALICSSYVPFYSGIAPPCFQGTPYFDGGFSNNQPTLDQWTVKISPFAGENDICPDDCSKSFHHVNFSGTSAQINCNNAYRISVAFLPPSPEILSEMCQAGFEDALRFLRRNGLISCSQHVSIRSAISSSQTFRGGLLDEQSIHSTRVEVLESARQARAKKDTKIGMSGGKAWRSMACVSGCRSDDLDADSCNDDDDTEDEDGLGEDEDDSAGIRCLECQKMSDSSREDKPPSNVLKALNDACMNANKGFKSKLYKYKHLMWLAAPYVIPCSYTYAFCKKLLLWAPNAPTSVKATLDNLYNLFFDVVESDHASLSQHSKDRLVSWVSLFGRYCGLQRCQKKELFSIFFPGSKETGKDVSEEEGHKNTDSSSDCCRLQHLHHRHHHHHHQTSTKLTFPEGDVDVMRVTVEVCDTSKDVPSDGMLPDAIRADVISLDQSTADSYENSIRVANQRDAILSYCYLEESDGLPKVNVVEIIPL